MHSYITAGSLCRRHFGDIQSDRVQLRLRIQSACQSDRPKTVHNGEQQRRTNGTVLNRFPTNWCCVNENVSQSYVKRNLTGLINECCEMQLSFHKGYTSVYHGEPEKGVSTSGKCCSCCSCCKPKPTGIKSNVTASMSLRTGPLNRQDIFYSGSLIRMSACKNDMKQRPDLQIEKATEKKGKCRITLKPFVNLLRMLIDVSLLKSPTYGVISLALFLYIFGLFTPYVYLASTKTSSIKVFSFQ